MISLRICVQPVERFYFIGRDVGLFYEIKKEQSCDIKRLFLFLLNGLGYLCS